MMASLGSFWAGFGSFDGSIIGCFGRGWRPGFVSERALIWGLLSQSNADSVAGDLHDLRARPISVGRRQPGSAMLLVEIYTTRIRDVYRSLSEFSGIAKSLLARAPFATCLIREAATLSW